MQLVKFSRVALAQMHHITGGLHYFGKQAFDFFQGEPKVDMVYLMTKSHEPDMVWHGWYQLSEMPELAATHIVDVVYSWEEKDIKYLALAYDRAKPVSPQWRYLVMQPLN